MSLLQIKLDPPATLQEVQDAINNTENPLLEFVGIFETGHFPAPNILYFKAHDNGVHLNPVQLEQINANLSLPEATALVDSRIDAGLAPFDNFFDINLSGGEITVLPFRANQPLAVGPGGDGWIQTKATVFGLNMDGSFDSEDNGVGSPILGSINTRDSNLTGAAVPIRLAKQLIGSLANVKGHNLEVIHLTKNLKIQAPIVDFGPSEGQVAKGIALDLTLAAQKAIGGDGMTPVKYRFL